MLEQGSQLQDLHALLPDHAAGIRKVNRSALLGDTDVSISLFS